MELEINALAQSLSMQASMGSLLSKVLSQSEEMLKEQSATTISNSSQSPTISKEGVGELLDVIA